MDQSSFIALLEGQRASRLMERESARTEKAAAEAAALACAAKIGTCDIQIAELDSLLAAVTSTDGVERDSRGAELDAVNVSLNDATTLRVVSSKPNDARRGPRGAWSVIMPEMLRQYPSEIFLLQDVEAAAELTGQSVKPETIRSQMSNYAKAGYIERVNPGAFRFTDQGRAIFSELSKKPSVLRLVTDAPSADGVYALGASPEGSDPSKGTATSFSVGRASR